MVQEIIIGVIAKKLLEYGLDTAQSLLKPSRIAVAFEKACIEVIKKENVLFDDSSVQAISSLEGIPKEETLWFRLEQSLATNNFPNTQQLTVMLVESWRSRKKHLDPSEASDFFSLSEELVQPIIQKISERFFIELAQIPELATPFIIQELMKHTCILECFSEYGMPPSLKCVQPDIFPQPSFPTALVDERIEEEINILRRSRFFGEFDSTHYSLALARKLVEGELSGGSKAIISRALAWCVRILSRTAELEKTEKYLKLAKNFGTCLELDIASAFISSHKGDKQAALSTLAGINVPISCSASLMVVAHHEGPQGAIDWLKTAGIDTMDLDPDGKFFLLMYQLQLAHWDAAQVLLSAVTDDDLRDSPILHRIVALTKLLSTVPKEFRSSVLNQVPFQLIDFPFASNSVSIEARRTACQHFIIAAEVALQLNCPRTAEVDEEYALWLELIDPEKSKQAQQRLEVKLHDPKSALHLVRFGLQFGVKLDLKAVEREIERQIALNGGLTYDSAIARFSLAFTRKTPEDISNYITRYREQLSSHIDKKAMGFLQIEMLSRAGIPERANECLKDLLKEGLSEVEETRLRSIISESEGNDPVDVKKKQFKSSHYLGDLISLVDELESKHQWDSLCEYGQILFDETRSLHDAERLARALINTQRNEQLVEFLKVNTELLQQSKNLQMAYCWSLCNEGEFLEARSELAKLSDDPNNTNYRALQITLGIALGDWNSLSAIVANECLEKNKRSAQDLLSAAQLAFHIGSPSAKELIFAAAEKGSDDARVLTSAYLLATKAGLEDDEEVFKWLQKASTLSGDDGPLKTMKLKDILVGKPEWDRQESETWKMLSCGDIPMFIAAQYLNKSLIDIMLFPALANLSESDSRRRGIVSAYSGKRQATPFKIEGTVGIDATALLTLSFLNLLDEVLNAFDTIQVPHSTLTWLFEEKQKATFYQPSRIKDAHQVRDLLATDALEKLIPSTVSDSDLSAQIGDELALLIAEAQKVRDDDDIQHIVVRSSPVHRVASLMEEEADLTAHAGVLSSCQSIVDKLRQAGQITTDQGKKACAYLQLHEKPWPYQPEIEDAAILYLDDLAIAYFLHLGILEKLKAAGFRPIVSPREVSKTNEFISYESISGRINETIERIRFAINSGIESGKIKVGKQHNTDEFEEQSISEHPTIGVFALVKDCDAIIVDDRSFNQHANIDGGSAQTPIFSTLDLIDALVSSEFITPEARLEYRTQLRRAGYFFVPVSDDELAGYLCTSKIKNGKVVETAELKAIRENILRVRMSTWLQIPKEAPWLDSILKVFIRVLKGLWSVDADIPSVRSRSDWILDQIDVRGWAQSIGGESGDSIFMHTRGAHMLMMLSPLVAVPQEVKDEYWRWVEGKVLTPIKDHSPDLYTWIVSYYLRLIAKIADKDLTEGDI